MIMVVMMKMTMMTLLTAIITVMMTTMMMTKMMMLTVMMMMMMMLTTAINTIEIIHVNVVSWMYAVGENRVLRRLRRIRSAPEKLLEDDSVNTEIDRESHHTSTAQIKKLASSQ